MVNFLAATCRLKNIRYTTRNFQNADNFMTLDFRTMTDTQTQVLITLSLKGMNTCTQGPMEGFFLFRTACYHFLNFFQVPYQWRI